MRCVAVPDHAARFVAVTEFDRNVVVEAGAGTGKTSLLVERLLVALGSGRVRLPQIAAITFTDKAAGQMRERLGDGLETLRSISAGDDRRSEVERGSEADRAYAFLHDAGVSNDTLRSRTLDALHALDRATVTTVHGFCAEILRIHPFEAGVAPDFEIDRGERFAAAFPAAWEQFLARELGADGQRVDLWARVLASFKLDTVEQAARALSRSHVPLDVLDCAAPWPDARALFGFEATALADRIDALLIAVPRLGLKARDYLDAALTALRTFAVSGLDTALRAELGRGVLAGASPQANKSLPPEYEPEFYQVVGESRLLLRALARIDDPPLRDLVVAIEPFARGFRESLVAAGFVDFDGLLARTREVLCRSLPVRESVKARFAMLLVDEYQDTDPLQYEIMLQLAERPGAAAADPFDAELEPGRLFIVGDPKQSVYRFRGADYTAYQRARARVIEQGGCALTLTANFRAVPEVLDPVNLLFDGSRSTVWAASEYQPPYQPIDPVRDPVGSGPEIELWSVLLAGANAAQRRQAEGRLLARRIRELWDPKRRPWGDFTILLRAFTDVSRYVRPLRDAGIPFVVTGGRAFHERTEVIRLLAHLRLLACPDDPPTLLAWLRSPAGGVPDPELATWARVGGAWDRSARPDPARWPQLARAFEDVRSLEERVRDLPLDALVRATLEMSLLPVFEGFAFEGAQRVANLRKLASQACELARDGSMSLRQIVDALEERASFEPEGDSPLADENTDAVRVLTVHVAKGLEAPVIFVPDLARLDAPGARDAVEAGVFRGPFGTALALSAGEARNAARVALERDNARHATAEGVRLLYVALTRARDRIVLFAGRSVRNEAPPWIEPLRAWGYDQGALPVDGALLAGGRVLHRIAIEVDDIEPIREPTITGSPEAAAAYGRAAAAMAASADRPPLRAPSGDAEDLEGAIGVAERASELARDPARAVGTAVHRLLQRWRPEAPIESEAIAAVSRSAAAERRCDPLEVEREVTSLLAEFANGPFPAIISNAADVRREIPVLRRDDDGRVWRGRADLILRNDANDWVVVDFKTDAGTDDTALMARHGSQLRVYASALRDALRLPRAPRAQLWMLRTGAIVEIAV